MSLLSPFLGGIVWLVCVWFFPLFKANANVTTGWQHENQMSRAGTLIFHTEPCGEPGESLRAPEPDEPCASLCSGNLQFAADSSKPRTSEPMLEGFAPRGTHSPPVTPKSPVPPLDPSHPTHPSAFSFPTQPPALSSFVQFQVTAPKPRAPRLHSRIP